LAWEREVFDRTTVALGEQAAGMDGAKFSRGEEEGKVLFSRLHGFSLAFSVILLLLFSLLNAVSSLAPSV